jgi:hypothetical protein
MTRQDFGDGVFEDHVQVTIEQKPFQSADGIQHLRTAQATDDADITKLLHEVPARRRKTRLWAKAWDRQNPFSHNGVLTIEAMLAR